MHVFLDEPFPSGRTHPWTHVEGNSSLKYYDFKESPSLITEVLEDFKPWAKYSATQTFYGLLRWINGKHSLFESNDCCFSGPAENSDLKFPKKLQCHGRLLILFRRLDYNLTNIHTQWLKAHLHLQLKDRDNEFKWGVVGISDAETMFLCRDNSFGKIVAIKFWAWGDSEKETMRHQDRIFKNLLPSLRHISDLGTKKEWRLPSGISIVTNIENSH